MFNDQNFSLRDFQEWLSNYNQNKKNQQNFGVQNIPARIFRKTIDLSVAGVLQNTGIPFDGLQVEKIYNTASGVSVDGSINIIFDRAMSDSQFNYKTLKENDSFTSGTSISRAFFSWAAQSGISADVVFFNDIDYKSGSQKTTLVGTVSVQNTNTTPLYEKSLVPVVTAISLSNTTNANVRTIAAGLYAWVTIQCSSGGAVGCSANISGTKIIDCSSFSSTQVTSSIRICVPAGTVFGMTSNNAGAIVSFTFEEYTVI